MRTIENNIINANIKLQDENKLLKEDIKLLQAKLDAMYQTALENINSIKLQIRILESQLSREYGNAGKGGF